MENTQKIIKGATEFIEDIKINNMNKALMIEKILSYSSTLESGIEKYKAENRRFTIFILLSVILINVPLLSLLFCIAATVFLLKMLHFIKYRSAYNIVKKMGKDIAYKGIYNKGIIEEMVEDFKLKYGEDVIEYYELVYMVEKYEAFIMKIEKVIKGIDKENFNGNWKEEYIYREYDGSSALNDQYGSIEDLESLKDNNCKKNTRNPLLYKNEDGEIKKVNRAIEFFDDKNKSTDAVVLRGGNKKDRKLTVYLYKKNNELQDNVL